MNENDPRFLNEARKELMTILDSLEVPSNYRVVMSVNKDTEKLQLQVLKRNVTEIRITKKWVWRFGPSWDSEECVQRSITARSYESLLSQLREQPEFLEFEVVITSGDT